MKQTVLVAGCGRSGTDAALLLLKTGSEVILYDGNTSLNRADIQSALPVPCEIVLGELPRETALRVSYCVISPGIPLEVPFVLLLRELGIPVISEIELAWRFEKGRVIGITGTNGKTTTTALTGAIRKAYLGEDRAFTAGNIGTPYTGEVLKSREDSVTTIELSSFQLETVDTFRPHVSAILNITPDHLNRHHTMENYIAVKERAAMNQGPEDFCVLNYGDPVLRAFGEQVPVPVVWFSGNELPENGYGILGDSLVEVRDGAFRVLMHTSETSLVGQCNYENILAAIAISACMQVPEEVILETVRRFKAVPHRIEFVEEIGGVRYYNDSKGTNPDAAVQALKAMNGPILLIAGGYDKGSDFDEWAEYFPGRVKRAVLLGATKEKIAACLDAHGFRDYTFAESLKSAAEILREEALPGENVLLSPACASWDMFKSYEERGDLFKQYVRSWL